MENRRRIALISGVAAALLVIAAAIGWQVVQHRADQAFIAEQYAQLEADEAALADSAPPAFNPDRAGAECVEQWRASSDARSYWELHSVTTSPATEVTEGLHSIPGHASGSNGQKDIETNFSCTATLDGDEWVIELA